MSIRLTYLADATKNAHEVEVACAYSTHLDFLPCSYHEKLAAIELHASRSQSVSRLSATNCITARILGLNGRQCWRRRTPTASRSPGKRYMRRSRATAFGCFPLTLFSIIPDPAFQFRLKWPGIRMPLARPNHSMRSKTCESGCPSHDHSFKNPPSLSTHPISSKPAQIRRCEPGHSPDFSKIYPPHKCVEVPPKMHATSPKLYPGTWRYQPKLCTLDKHLYSRASLLPGLLRAHKMWAGG